MSSLGIVLTLLWFLILLPHLTIRLIYILTNDPNLFYVSSVIIPKRPNFVPLT